MSSNGEKFMFGGIAFDNLDMSEAIDRIEKLISDRIPRLVVTPNVDHVLRGQKDRSYADLVRRATVVLADGQPIVWASRILKRPLKERVAGSDLFPYLCERAANKNFRVFLLGGNPGTADRAAEIMTRRYPGLNVVGTCCPPFGFEKSQVERQRVLDAVRTTRPDLVFVGLGSPKQERWIIENMNQYNAPVSIGVGITFSFIAGDVKRAPLWMRRLGLEWLHRLCSEPRRLWRRYLMQGPAFLPLLVKEWWSRKQPLGTSQPAGVTRIQSEPYSTRV